MLHWLTILIANGALAQAPPSPVEYRIQRAASAINIDARLDEPAWQRATPTSSFLFNWFTAGEKEQTEARLLWDDDNLYVSWRCADRHISAYETKRHGPVSKDDCVEIFISPNPQKVRNYYTFEINAIGTMLNRCRTDWFTGGPTWEPEGVRHRATYSGLARKDESADDREWIVEMVVPLRNFARDAAHMPPRHGDEWRLNLMRTGGKTNAQQSTFSPILPPSRSFHSPENFGKVVFVAQNPTAPQPEGKQAGGRRRRIFSGPVNAADAAVGREIYNKSCTMCHGLDGAGGDRAPALGAQRRYLRRTEDELFDAIKNGIRGTLMPASPAPDADVRKMVAFIRSLRATAADAGFEGNVAAGETIFNGKGNCTKCHMIKGRGGILGPDLTNIASERRVEDLRLALTTGRPQPSEGFKPVALTLKSGARIDGVIKNEDSFSMQVLSKDEKLHMILREEASRIEYSERSPMPSGLDKKLAADEFRDLLAFLCRQTRQPR
ncbi:MAG: c-type cytochrome [Acidobacteria bacterium]|nr:c-type cytochrome [Acidobacteriota bacterium]